MSSTRAHRASRIRLDDDGRIAQDISCLECDYNLRTLRLDGVCPECGTDVRRAILGDLLYYADAAWVRRLALGMKILWWWLATMLLFPFVGWAVLAVLSLFGPRGGQQRAAVSSGPSSGIVNVLSSVGGGLLVLAWLMTPLVGVWFLTTPEPRISPDREDPWARRVLRYAFPGMCVLALVAEILLRRLGLAGANDPPWVFTPLQCMNGVLLLCYMAHLGKRLPDRSLPAIAGVTAGGLAVVAVLQVVGVLMANLWPSFGFTRIMYSPALLVGGIAALAGIGLLDRFKKELSKAAKLSAEFTWPPQQPPAGEEHATADQ
jgi:hypothetical protein